MGEGGRRISVGKFQKSSPQPKFHFPFDITGKPDGAEGEPEDVNVIQEEESEEEVEETPKKRKKGSKVCILFYILQLFFACWCLQFTMGNIFLYFKWATDGLFCIAQAASTVDPEAASSSNAAAKPPPKKAAKKAGGAYFAEKLKGPVKK